jgi:hypothetical protein
MDLKRILEPHPLPASLLPSHHEVSSYLHMPSLHDDHLTTGPKQQVQVTMGTMKGKSHEVNCNNKQSGLTAEWKSRTKNWISVKFMEC